MNKYIDSLPELSELPGVEEMKNLDMLPDIGDFPTIEDIPEEEKGACNGKRQGK